MSTGAIYCVYEDHEYLEESLAVTGLLDKVLFLMSDVTWNGVPSDNSATVARVKDLCARNTRYELIQGHWITETDQRNYGLSLFFKWGIDIALIIDSDEIYSTSSFQNLLSFISMSPSVDAFHIEWDTYWTKQYYVIRPRERFRPLVAVRPAHFLFTLNREGITSVLRSENSVVKYDGAYNGIVIPPDVTICHHMSYARSDADIKRKIETFSHASEIISGWYEKVWLKWKPGDVNLHPVTPAQYQTAVPSRFRDLPDHFKTFVKKERASSCSIIILNWNSKELLKRCLRCIRDNTKDIKYEIIIVDNGSTKDDSVAFLRLLERHCPMAALRVIYNDSNKGFAPAVNQAMRTTFSDVCLLNVDAEPQSGWLENMYETLYNHSGAGMVGPLGNRVASGYQAEGSLKEDTIAINLHGFCILISRMVVEDVGYLDEQFRVGGYEDNDLGMRAKLAGYELWLSARALVRHEAHQVFRLNGMDPYEHEGLNREIYVNKYHGALYYLSHFHDLYANKNMAQAMGLYLP